MKFDEGKAGFGNGTVVMVVVAEDADTRGDFHLGGVGIGDVSREEDFGGPRRETFDAVHFFCLPLSYDPAVKPVVAAEAFGIAELHALFQRPAEEEDRKSTRLNSSHS